MTFFCLAIFLISGWLFSWWMFAVLALLLGIFLPKMPRASWHVMSAASLAYLTIAYLLDIQSSQQISYRLAGLIQLPSPYLFLLLATLLNTVTVGLSFQSGRYFRERCRGGEPNV